MIYQDSSLPLPEIKTRYINPYTDFGFKRLFGTEMNKDLLIGFLNALLKLEHQIVDVTYLNTSQLGDGYSSRHAVFDVYCKSDAGEYFIVEMQRGIQQNFVDRSIFYASFPIRDQAPKGGDWNFQLSSVYTVGILDFCFDDREDYYHHEVMLMDKNTKEVFYDKLTFVYLEMPKFKKDIGQCETFLDKWMFVLKNLTRLLNRPAELQERVFTRLFEAAEMAAYTFEEQLKYRASLKVYWDDTNVLNTAVETAREEALEKGRAEGMKQGRAEGMEQGRAEGMEQGRSEERMQIAINMRRMGLPVAMIMQATGLPEDDIQGMAVD